MYRLPEIIQAGMGIDISNFLLAKKCSIRGAIGTVSCTAAERILANKLQLGDVGGYCRRILREHFPFPEVSERILAQYFVEGGKKPEQKFKDVPLFSFSPPSHLIELAVAASFVFVFLAKEGHTNPISVNYLEKLQIAHIYHLTGAMLADVDLVTMGAGITLQIPAVLDAIAAGGSPSYRASVEGSKEGTKTITFNPREFFGERFPKKLRRPGFLPIVSTDVLASLMVSKLPGGSIQGFVIETPIAGGHNAPPRKKGVFDILGQPVYGAKDEVNFEKLCNLGIPFWIAGGFASPEGLAKAKSLGATGIQVGSAFALCEESGMGSVYRAKIRRLGFRGELVVRTDPTASPTGFPFKVPQLDGTISEPTIYEARKRVCSRRALQFPAEYNGKTIFRCSAEPIVDYLRKGGKLEDTVGARCLCNGLFSAADIGDPEELPIFTMGDDVSFLRHLMSEENDSYNAADAIAYLSS